MPANGSDSRNIQVDIDSRRQICDQVTKNKGRGTHPRAFIRARNSNIALLWAAYFGSDRPTGERRESPFFFFFWRGKTEKLVDCVTMLIECKC